MASKCVTERDRSISKPSQVKPHRNQMVHSRIAYTLYANDIALWCALNMLVLDAIYNKIYDIFSNGILQSDKQRNIQREINFSYK